MKTLYIVRHAKSSWSNHNLIDFERPLNHRGKGDAPKMARYLFNEIGKVDYIISSPAKRAMETAKCFSNQFSIDRIEIEGTIYEASLQSLTSIVESIEDAFSTAILCGHNPGLSLLIDHYLNEMHGHLPTCGIVGIDFYIDKWNMITKGLGNSKFKFYPKQISV